MGHIERRKKAKKMEHAGMIFKILLSAKHWSAGEKNLLGCALLCSADADKGKAFIHAVYKCKGVDALAKLVEEYL